MRSDCYSLARRGSAAGVVCIALLIGCGDDDRSSAGDESGATLSAAQREHLLGGVAAERLSVLLLTIDTLRADRLSSYGSNVATPALDRLAAEGWRFANASTTVPFTLPAHSSMLTGTYPPFHGVRENVGFVLNEAQPTMAEMMAGSGRETAGFVSAFVLDSRWGIARGFETYHDDFDLQNIEGANLGSVQRDGAETLDRVEEWLSARSSDRPFFLWVHLFDPHDPYTPIEPYRSQYAGRPYDAEVAYTDSLVARLRQMLDDHGALDELLWVTTADHGEGLGDHGEAFHGYFVYDSTVHVPLIVRPPGGARQGTISDAAVSHVDLVPTVLEATNVATDAQLHGVSLLGLLDGESTSADVAAGQRALGVYAESYYPKLHYGWSPLRSLRSGSYKFIEAPSPELYALADDPGELTSVLQEERQRSRDLRGALEELEKRIASGAPENATADLDEETLAQLRALGYLAGAGTASTGDIEDDERADPKDKLHLHQLLMLAQSDVGEGRYGPAAEALTRALEEDGGLLDAHQMMGSIRMAEGDEEAAVEYFQAALGLNGEHQASLFGLATAYRRLGRLEEAVVGYERVLSLAPSDTKTALALTEIHVEVDDLRAARSVLEASAAGREPPPLLFNKLGEVLALQGELDPARRQFEAALAANDDLAQAHFNLGALAEEESRWDDARAGYERAIERNPRHFQAQFNLGNLLGRAGSGARQIELYRDAIASNPQFVLGRYVLAKVLMDRDELTEAERTVREGLDLDPDGSRGPLGWYVLADILNRRGRAGDARAALARGREVEAQMAASGGG